MVGIFYLSAAVAVLSTVLVITRRHAVHALLYLIVSLLAVAMVFFSLGAPFAAALEVIIYAGAIMVLFVFVIMMLNLGPGSRDLSGDLTGFPQWIGPLLLAAVLLLELLYAVREGAVAPAGQGVVGPKAVGIALYGPYLLGVELISLLLLAGLVGAYHLGRRGGEEE
ncbi:MAG: NADH-quinone oxidoreductase subunit J [Alphaproteobacteria bacterium]|uniref:NADH-quinone oxidoreductase subunit J n=1 Tax=Candidatus Nitrobium versatile TaxID=2884831 RepID=A0A953JF82_9BACT|nr:NADH-quinone oxidoreductase subunit J [Candidatus Nitrobium versatile]